MEWNGLIVDFEFYLKLEKSLSENTIEAYGRDMHRFVEYLSILGNPIHPSEITLTHFINYFTWLGELGIGARSQARMISGLKSFYRYLQIDGIITENPTEQLETPHLARKLPEVLSIEEIDSMESAIDLSVSEGQRNKAIIETLYSCGLRVSELIGLKISNLHFNDGYIRVIGKGNKERLVPISKKAIREIEMYDKGYRVHLDITKQNVDFLFLNHYGRPLSRVMVFLIVKSLASKIGLKKIVSPHTFRHSFATHLVDGGADLRAVQEMLGHESIITTEIYTHIDRQYLRDAINRFHPRSIH
jgi:integrase/recombinase XerD